MSHGPRQKTPLDVLQSMLNAVLIETGRVLRPSGKDGGKSPGITNNRLKLAIPSCAENFQLALDDLECDILRAKAVLLRDLEELRAKRYTLENPLPIVEEVEPIPEPEPEENGDLHMEGDTAGFGKIKEESIQSTSPQKHDPEQRIEDPSIEDIAKATADSKEQGLTPPPSNEKESKPIGLGINTDGVGESPAAGTADVQNSSIDSLFDTGDSELFENMDFSMHDSNQDQSHTDGHGFDLSTFGSNTQGFNMTDTQPDANAANDTNNGNKAGDNLFGMDDAGDNIDLSLDMEMAGAEDSLFDDMFLDGDTSMSGGGEMEHGDFDAAFFSLDN